MLLQEQQFRIPIYQRRYSWKENECRKLLEDISRAADGKDAYFIGTIVSVGVPVVQGNNPIYMVIDGQQRLTTVMLILSALKNEFGSKYAKTSNEIADCIHNRYVEGNDRYKLIATAKDQNTLKCIMDNEDLPDEYSEELKNNYEAIKLFISETGPEKIWEGIKMLTVANILLQHGDRPQLVFESINSTGQQLKKADLIRNYVLMDLPEHKQNEIYEKKWRPLENSFVDNRLSDDFVRDFLTIKTMTAVRTEDIYKKFKSWMTKQNNIYDALDEITDYAACFTRMEYWEDSDDELRDEFENIDRLGMDVMRPLLIQAMRLHSRGAFGKIELKEIFHAVESYVFRRAVCGLRSAGLNKSVPTLLKKMADLQSEYVDGIRHALASLQRGQRFPSNDEFRSRFITSPIYGTKAAKYALFRLENHMRSNDKNYQPLGFHDKWSIEHVMPKNISAWKNDLDVAEMEKARDWIDSIGNLTITGYNSELSDKAFSEKVSMKGGYADSPYLLCKDLRGTSWKTDEICRRSDMLGDIAVNLWAHHGLVGQDPKDGESECVTETDYFEGDHTPGKIPDETMSLFEHAKDVFAAKIPGLECCPRVTHLAFLLNGQEVFKMEVKRWHLELVFNLENCDPKKESVINYEMDTDGTYNCNAIIHGNNDVLEVLSYIQKLSKK